MSSYPRDHNMPPVQFTDSEGIPLALERTDVKAYARVVRVTREVIFDGEVPVGSNGRMDLTPYVPTDTLGEYEVLVSGEVKYGDVVQCLGDGKPIKVTVIEDKPL